ncbi:transmembrane emp24 domain-containing protein A-like [Cataglyphis hispanica]|uniref:transmembrane emp24 domain-containing protein A-like n=1 Tax=Cataglyphis hispanica TaxID=1086592 RepID=UPI00217FEDA1|nr:transmembrane emp24 domain-containing protein A-like [Cataglyphis hispanica]
MSYHIQLVLISMFLFLITPFETKISFSYRKLPVIVKKYEVRIDTGKEDCYYQYVNAGANFYVSFQVLRGGDRKTGFEMKNPEGNIIYPWQWRRNTTFHEQSVNGGYYSICIDNRLSLFAPKHVKLFFITISSDQWQQYKQEVEEQILLIQNFTNTIVHVEKNVNKTLQILHWSSSRKERNLNLLLVNNSYISLWSILQAFSITVMTMMHVYFIKKLFDKIEYFKTRI